MQRVRLSLTALVLTGTLAAFGAGPANAGATYVSNTCVASDVIPTTTYTTCASAQDTHYAFDSAGGGTTYGLRLTAPPAHCAPVQYQVWSVTRNNVMYGKTQRFLNAGESEIVPIGRDFPRGYQRVAIRALGQIAGCNVGRMHSWGAMVEAVIIPE